MRIPEIDEYLTPPPQLSGAIAAVNEAMGRLRLVIEHRGGTMLPFADLAAIGLCDGFNVFIDKTQALRVFTRRSSENHHDRLIALLKDHPSREQEDAEMSAMWARNHLHMLVTKLSPEKVDSMMRALDAEFAASAAVAVGDAVDPVGEPVAKQGSGANIKIDDDVVGVAIVGGEKLDVAAAGAIARPHAERAVGEVQSGAVAHGDSPVEAPEPSR